MVNLEDFLQGKPLNERMAALMKGEDEEPATEAGEGARSTQAQNYADGTPITKEDREHLRRTLAGHGWQVLLKLLDTALASQEDAARRMSLNRATPKEQRDAAWEMVAANRDARNWLVGLAETEVAKLKKKVPSTQYPVPSASNPAGE